MIIGGRIGDICQPGVPGCMAHGGFAGIAKLGGVWYSGGGGLYIPGGGANMCGGGA